MSSAQETIDYIIDETSQVVEQPEKIKIPLKPHQLALIYKMLELENPDLKSLNCDDTTCFRSDFGAICDRVGSGKSLTVLGLVSTKPFIEPTQKCFRSFGNLVHVYSKTILYLPINVIVVPHGIVKQWEDYLTKFTKLKFMTIKNTKTLKSFSDNMGIFKSLGQNNFDIEILLVSSSQYNKTAQEFKDNFKCIGVSRLFVDEVDSIKIPSSKQIKSEFTWFITSSNDKIQHPRGRYESRPFVYTSWTGEEIQTVRSVVVDKMNHSGFFRDLLIELVGIQFKNQIYLKSKDEFVQNSFNLPPIKDYLIKCLGNLYVNVLNGLVPQEVMNMINAGDIQSAVESIGCDTKDEDSLIKMVTKDLEKNLNNKQIEYSAKQQMTYSTPTAKEQALIKIQKDIKEIEGKISSLKERVIDTNACPICCDEITNKVVMKCCNNVFCLECITMSLNHKPNCPLCRKGVGKKDLIVIKEEIEEKIAECESDDDSTRTKLENLMKYVDKIMSKNKKSKIKRNRKKILIFSEFEYSFSEIETFLTESSYTFDKLKGTTTSINNKVVKYKNDEIDILLLNSKYFGSGLNLENTTDMFLLHKMSPAMEKQVIGRAQRPGRKDPLKLYRLYYENEI